METSQLTQRPITELEYRQHPALNQSALKQILRSPKHFQEYLRNPPEQTPAMLLGTRAHQAILEPERFHATHIRMPDFGDGRTAAAKAAKAAFEAANVGKTVLKADEYDALEGIVNGVYSHTRASQLLTGGTPETPVFATLSGVECKGMPDFVRDGREIGMDSGKPVVIDIKTTQDARPSAFKSTLINFNYDLQAAFYLDLLTQATGIAHELFVIVAVETKAPYVPATYVIDFGTLELGRMKYKRALEIYKKCVAENRWPGYGDDLISLAAPAWAFEQGVDYE